MSIAALAVDKRAFTIFATAILLLGGMFSFTKLGRLEDPEFTVKTAVVMTPYAGATAEEVELEVTDRIELAIQEMPQLKNVYSFSRPGLSVIKVDIRPQYTADLLAQVWDELRKKTRDVRESLPPGAGKPEVSDDFGDVYGFLMAVTSDGFTYAELERYVDHIKKELSVVDGVARVELWGDQAQCIYVEVKEAQLTTMGLNVEDVYQTLTEQNRVVNGGGIDIQDERLRRGDRGERHRRQDQQPQVFAREGRPRISRFMSHKRQEKNGRVADQDDRLVHEDPGRKHQGGRQDPAARDESGRQDRQQDGPAL